VFHAPHRVAVRPPCRIALGCSRVSNDIEGATAVNNWMNAGKSAGVTKALRFTRAKKQPNPSSAGHRAEWRAAAAVAKKAVHKPD
jgi:hypothetical protein